MGRQLGGYVEGRWPGRCLAGKDKEMNLSFDGVAVDLGMEIDE